MALTHGVYGNIIFDPFLLSSIFNPLENLSLFVRMFSSFPRELNTMASAGVFKADLPGLKKEEIKVLTAGDGVKSISGERSKKEDSYRRFERSDEEFYRRFKLPCNAKVQDVSAKLGNVVLTVTVPKIKVTNTPKLCDVEIFT